MTIIKSFISWGELIAIHVQSSHICIFDNKNSLLNHPFLVIFRALMDLPAMRMCAYTTLDVPSSMKG